MDKPRFEVGEEVIFIAAFDQNHPNNGERFTVKRYWNESNFTTVQGVRVGESYVYELNRTLIVGDCAIEKSLRKIHKPSEFKTLETLMDNLNKVEIENE